MMCEVLTEKIGRLTGTRDEGRRPALFRALAPRWLTPLLALVCFAPAAWSQGLNLDFGTSYGVPASAYGAAAGQAGNWNQVGLGVSGLLDLSGVASSASVNLVAFTAGGNTGAVPVNDDELLLADNFFTGSGGTWSVTLSGLSAGDYLVYLYAPSNAAVPSGAMTVGGTAVASIPGDPGSALVEGTSWVKTRVCLSGGTLAISGSANLSGLAGLQLAPAPPFENYCTAGVSASGCAATLMGSGVPSATAVSGFTLSAANVEGGKNGIYFFGSNGRQANSWGSGTSFQCVVPPVGRAGLLSGSGTTGLCDGSFAQDFNALWCPSCPKPAKNPGAGAVVQVQLWYRDPFNTSNQTTSLSDAIEFCVGP